MGKNQKKCLRQIRKFKRTAEIRIAPTVQPAVKDEDANDKEAMQTARMSPSLQDCLCNCKK
jgi:hypothetical protein